MKSNKILEIWEKGDSTKTTKIITILEDNKIRHWFKDEEYLSEPTEVFGYWKRFIDEQGEKAPAISKKEK